MLFICLFSSLCNSFVCMILWSLQFFCLCNSFLSVQFCKSFVLHKLFCKFVHFIWSHCFVFLAIDWIKSWWLIVYIPALFSSALEFLYFYAIWTEVWKFWLWAMIISLHFFILFWKERVWILPWCTAHTRVVFITYLAVKYLLCFIAMHKS